MPFTRLLNNVNKIVNDIDNITVGAMMEVKEEIIDLNTSQLEAGKLSTGELIEPGYVFDEYSKYKRSIGSKAPFGVPNLKLEGGYYSGKTITPLNDGIEMKSTDIKAPKLEGKYTSNIEGLTDNNKSEVSEMILPTIQNKILNGFIK